MTSLIGANIQRYFDFCIERHKIFIKKQAGEPWPWTNDLILQTYKFTNVYRELDKGTVWLRENIREPYATHPELFFNIAMYRRYNYWPMAEYLLDVYGGLIDSYEKVESLPRIVKEYRAAGNQVFTGAHMINCPKPYTDKVDYVFDVGAKDLWNKRRDITRIRDGSLESWYNRMLTVNGVGPFIAYEIVSDLRWTRYLDQASDIMTWANPGPGCMRGIQRLMGLKTSSSGYGTPTPAEVRHQYPSREGYIDVMRFLLKESQKRLPDWMPAWEMREVEHSLCEWDKYERTRTGEGRPRSKYHLCAE